jgi:hypothetical protein
MRDQMLMCSCFRAGESDATQRATELGGHLLLCNLPCVIDLSGNDNDREPFISTPRMRLDSPE